MLGARWGNLRHACSKTVFLGFVQASHSHRSGVCFPPVRPSGVRSSLWRACASLVAVSLQPTHVWVCKPLAVPCLRVSNIYTHGSHLLNQCEATPMRKSHHEDGTALPVSGDQMSMCQAWNHEAQGWQKTWAIESLSNGGGSLPAHTTVSHGIQVTTKAGKSGQPAGIGVCFVCVAAGWWMV